MMTHMMIIIKKTLLYSFASLVYISYLRLMLLNPTTDTCKQTALALGEMFVFVFGYLCMHSKQPPSGIYYYSCFKPRKRA